ncbi:MAG: sigma 54-interacting transcriptional regulator, partial [Gemmatimonadota bacterium]
MNEGVILVSTHDLRTAGDLRSAFREEGYEVELVTPGEELSSFDAAVLLILTGGLEGDAAAEMSATAREDLHVPVFGVAEKKEEGWRRLVHELDLGEIFFGPVDPDEILLLGRTLIERRRLREVTGIVGETEVMQEVMERVVQIAPVRSTVLVTGESGTGKELVARGIHVLSPRRHKSFIAVNVAALSETLLE